MVEHYESRDPSREMSDSDADGKGRSEQSYDVGYKRPPKHTQFGQGNTSGRGRPKGSRNAKTLFHEAFARRRKVKIDGQEVKESMAEIAMRQLALKAASGDPKAIGQFLLYAEKWSQDEDLPTELPKHLQARNDQILKNLVQRQRMLDELDEEDDDEQE